MDFLFNVQPGDIIYDFETYPNFYSAYFECADTDQWWYFEVSDWRNDTLLLVAFVDRCRQQKSRWVGFNSLGFDYPVFHFIYQNHRANLTAGDIYAKAMSIINAPFNAMFANMVWESDWVVEQIDLFKIHHFDNPSKSTSLKVLEFNMRSDNVEDLPFPVGTVLNYEQAQIVKAYNKHDVKETKKFLHHSKPQIEMRERLSQKFDQNMMNCSDVKIGEKILIHTLEERGIQCFQYVGNRKEKLQTRRDSIDVNQIIFPYIRFERYEFMQIHAELQTKVITETKGVFEDMVAVVDGLEYKFGTGGLHASVESQIICSSDTHQIVDVDVASYYPNLGIKNNLYPAHLGPEFCEAYNAVYDTRKTYKKGTPENEAYKLALNGAYGNSNNDYSSLKDSQYTMSITINGQLLLCVLVEQLIKVPGLTMIQANTDGVTYLCPREYLDHTRSVCRWWEGLTQLTLEEALYKRMFIRDVNSYIAEREDGKLKRIGAYAYETALENPGTRELPWHKDWSFRVIAKAAEAALVRGTDIREFIESHTDVHDFFGRTKVPRSSILRWGGKQVSNIVRYYVSTAGHKLEKVMPAAGPVGAYKRANGIPDYIYDAVVAELVHDQFSDDPGMQELGYDALCAMVRWDERIHTKNKSTYDERAIGIHTGWNVQLCNDLRQGVDVFADVNYDFYIKAAQKLVTLLKDDGDEQ
jgi:hypothetical protein